jgi:mRNA interferase HigB
LVGDRVIFNIRGGYYRLVTWVDYERKLVVMKWFGTHQEYQRGDWR